MSSAPAYTADFFRTLRATSESALLATSFIMARRCDDVAAHGMLTALQTFATDGSPANFVSSETLEVSFTEGAARRKFKDASWARAIATVLASEQDSCGDGALRPYALTPTPLRPIQQKVLDCAIELFSQVGGPGMTDLLGACCETVADASVFKRLLRAGANASSYVGRGPGQVNSSTASSTLLAASLSCMNPVAVRALAEWPSPALGVTAMHLANAADGMRAGADRRNIAHSLSLMMASERYYPAGYQGLHCLLALERMAGLDRRNDAAVADEGTGLARLVRFRANTLIAYLREVAASEADWDAAQVCFLLGMDRATWPGPIEGEDLAAWAALPQQPDYAHDLFARGLDIPLGVDARGLLRDLVGTCLQTHCWPVMRLLQPLVTNLHESGHLPILYESPDAAGNPYSVLGSRTGISAMAAMLVPMAPTGPNSLNLQRFTRTFEELEGMIPALVESESLEQAGRRDWPAMHFLASRFSDLAQSRELLLFLAEQGVPTLVTNSTGEECLPEGARACETWIGLARSHAARSAALEALRSLSSLSAPASASR